MTKKLIEWAADQSPWTSDSLRRIALAVDHVIEFEDLEAICQSVRHAAGYPGTPAPLTPLDGTHLGNGSDDLRRTTLTQIGPVRNIDRLAEGQRLRMAPNGITLVYGENGSGKSGYTRIAKRLCRSLSIDELRGNVFAGAAGPMQVGVRYQVGDDETTELEWNPGTAPPSVLRQISVFDSHNARLYVAGDNRIAYLPRELAILEHHGEICQRLATKFGDEQKALAVRVKVPLPAGYTAGTSVSKVLAQLQVSSPTLPTEAELGLLAAVSTPDLDELAELERVLASDPVALAAVRRRATALLTRVEEVLRLLSAELSPAVEATVSAARAELKAAVDAEQLAAVASFSTEPVPNVGGPAWRLLFEAARNFAALGQPAPPERLPDATGDLCLMCQEPLSSAASLRLARFNDFVRGDISRRADQARGELQSLVGKVEKVSVPSVDVVEDTLSNYRQLTPTRDALVRAVSDALKDYAKRRNAILQTEEVALPPPDVEDLILQISQDLQKLEEEATELLLTASHTQHLDSQRARLADLKDRVKFGHDLGVILQRRRDVAEQKLLATCVTHVATRSVSTQITAMRRLLVTQELERRIGDEIKALDLVHLPLKVSESSAGGQSLFSIGLQGVGRVKNNQILSEGEQRALALACFLAEIGGDDIRYGIIVDDPVSSLDHLRMRKVARRLVAEAGKGRQVIVFTHNIVFFNEMVSEAARLGETTPLVKSVISKSATEGFGIVTENSEPWIADVNARITSLRARAAALKEAGDFSSEEYRRQSKDFYSDLRETWERAVEEVVLNKTVERFVPDVMTLRLREVMVTHEDYRTIFFAVKRASERSGHDMPAARNLPPPSPDEMLADLVVLDEFRVDYRKRRKELGEVREALEKPRPATFAD